MTTYFFDFDGVILNSNDVKLNGFIHLASFFGPEAVAKVVKSDFAEPGRTREGKIKAFYCDMMGFSFDQREINKLADKYGKYCIENLKRAKETYGLRECLDGLVNNNCFIMSGTRENEVADTLRHKNLYKYFKDVYGGSVNKEGMIIDACKKHDIDPKDCVFIGDSKQDYESVEPFQIEFIFMSQYTIFTGWREYFRDKDCKVILNLSQLKNEVS